MALALVDSWHGEKKRRDLVFSIPIVAVETANLVILVPRLSAKMALSVAAKKWCEIG